MNIVFLGFSVSQELDELTCIYHERAHSKTQWALDWKGVIPFSKNLDMS